jgi:hypothetical protein
MNIIKESLLTRSVLAGAVLALTVSPAKGQYQAPSSLQGKTIVIPIGTTFEGRINSTIGSAISRQGERFNIDLSSPVLANGVDVLIPAGAEVTGEVVEAIPAKKVPHQKYEQKPIGKLRVELTSLKMPDGSTFPLVASIAPDKFARTGGTRGERPIGTGVAYMGSQASFEAVGPGNPRYASSGSRRGGAPKVVSPSDVLKDPILGRDKIYAQTNQRGAAIDSLVRKHNDLFIYSGSPITMRLEAPLKLFFNAAAGAAATLNASPAVMPESGGARYRRFEKDSEDLAKPQDAGAVSPSIIPGTQSNGGSPASHKDNANDSQF